MTRSLLTLATSLGLLFGVPAANAAPGDACDVPPGKFYSVDPSGAITRLIAIDPQTAAVQTVCALSGETGFQSNSLAFSPSGELFGWDSTNTRLYRIDLSAGAVEYVGSQQASDYQWENGLAFDSGRHLYGLNGATDELISIDPDTAAVEVVGQSYVDLRHVGLAVDCRTDELYAVTGCEDGIPEYLLGIYRSEPFTVADDFSTNTLGDYAWNHGAACGGGCICSESWDGANAEVDIRTPLTCGAGSSVGATRTLRIPSSGYAKVKLRVVGIGPWQDRIWFYLYQDAGNYYRFTVSKGAWNDGVQKVVGGSVVDISEGGDSVTANGEYTLEMWWSATYLKLSVNGTVVKYLATWNTTELKPSSFEFKVYRYDVDWESIELHSGIAQIIGEVGPGVDYCGIGTELDPITGELFTVFDGNLLTKIDVPSGQATSVGTLEGVSTMSLAGRWPAAAPTVTATPMITPTPAVTATPTLAVTPTPTATATATVTALPATPTATATPAGLCGNGVLDPGESCDDGNTVSGCRPDKPQKPLDGCLSNCQQPLCDDPSKIKLYDELTTGRKDLVQAHGRLITETVVDFGKPGHEFVFRISRRGCSHDQNEPCSTDHDCDSLSVGSTCTLTSAVFEQSLPGESITQAGKTKPSWKYKNVSADGDGGIYALKVISKMAPLACAGGSNAGATCTSRSECVGGGSCAGYYKFSVKAYGDAKTAVADMETQVFVDNRTWAVRGIWQQRPTGWKLHKKSTFLEPWP